MTTVALFNNKAGIGVTTLAYHLAHMISRLGHTVLAADLDPQANLTERFLDEDGLESLWGQDEPSGRTVAGAVYPLHQGLGDIRHVSPQPVADNLFLLPGDLGLSRFEERLAQDWPTALNGQSHAAAQVTTALHRLVRQGAATVGADVVLVDVGPNLGALNRAALLLADHVFVPLGTDLVSVQGLRTLGPTLRHWRAEWQETALPRIPPAIDAPPGRMKPLGYVVTQSGIRLDRPVTAYQLWRKRMPQVYATSVLGSSELSAAHHEIGTVRSFRSLMPLARDARKPMFDLRPADGAIGSTQRLVQVCLTEFRALAREVLHRLEVEATTG